MSITAASVYVVTRLETPKLRNSETRNQKLINFGTAQFLRVFGAYESNEIFFDFPLARRAGI